MLECIIKNVPKVNKEKESDEMTADMYRHRYPVNNILFLELRVFFTRFSNDHIRSQFTDSYLNKLLTV